MLIKHVVQPLSTLDTLKRRPEEPFRLQISACYLMVVGLCVHLANHWRGSMFPDGRLVAAVEQGSLDDLRLALAAGANINCRDFDGLSLLQIAERRRHNELVRILVENGANPNEIIDKQGNSHLHRAARTGNLGFAAALLASGAEVNLQNSVGTAALHIAVQKGYEYFARLLLRYSANVELAASDGKTALSIAEQSGTSNLARLLSMHRGVNSMENHAATTLPQPNNLLLRAARDSFVHREEQKVTDSPNRS